MSALARKKIIKAGIGYTVGNCLLKGLSFLTLAIFSRLMTTADYGLYNVFITYQSILYIILGIAIHSSYKNAKYKYGERFNEYISNSMVIIIGNTLMLAILGNVAYKCNLSFGISNIFLLNCIILYSMANAVITCFNNYLSLSYQYKAYLKLALTNAIMNILISIILMFSCMNSNRAYARIIGTVIPSVVFAFVIIIYFFKQSKPRINREYSKFAINFSGPIVAHGISQVILSSFDRIMINIMIGTIEAGIYSFAYNIFMIIQVTADSILVVWDTWFYEQYSKQKYELIKKYSTYLIVALAIVSSLVLFITPELIYILGGEKYRSSVYCAIPIILGGFLTILYNFPAEIEYFHAKTKNIAIATIFAAIINILLNYIFIRKYGYIAAAYTTLVTYIFYFIFHYIVAQRIQKEKVFTNNAFLVGGLLVFAAGMLTLFLVKVWLMRWFMAGIELLICIVIVVRNLGLKNICVFIKRL